MTPTNLLESSSMEPMERMELMELATVVPPFVGGGGTGVLRSKTQCSITHTAGKPSRRIKTACSTWPPKELRLPDSVEAIERGRPAKQRSLLQPDDSRAGRIARLLRIEGVKLGNTIRREKRL